LAARVSAGDNSYQASTSGADALSITKAATSTSVSSSDNNPVSGANVTLTATVNTQSNGVAPNGTVQFLNGSTPISGTVTYSGTNGSGATGAFATLQATLATSFSSTATITAKYNDDANYAGSTSAPLTITVIPGFELSSNPTSITITAPGQSGSSTITISPDTGFTGTVTFSCVVPTTMNEATCSANPSSLVTSGNTTLTITTTGPHTLAALPNKPDLLMATGVALLAGLLLITIAVRKRRSKVVLALCSVALVMAAFGGCGGGGGGGGGGGTTDPGTGAGTYSVAVTATSRSGSTSISRTANVSVTVQ